MLQIYFLKLCFYIIYKLAAYFEGSMIDFCNSAQVDDNNFIHIRFKSRSFTQSIAESLNWREVKIPIHFDNNSRFFHIL